MIRLDVTQGSPEWHAARLGIPTASAFDRIITKTGKPSAQAERYAWGLIAERILGVPLDSASSDFMQRGSALENEAIAYYELQRGLDTEAVGFCLTDDRRAGCSPDRLVGADGLLEIKCLSPALHIGALLGHATDDHRAQCQGQLWITGRRWVDLLFYQPDLPPAVVRLERDPEFIAALALAVTGLCDRLDAEMARLAEIVPPARRSEPPADWLATMPARSN